MHHTWKVRYVDICIRIVDSLNNQHTWKVRQIVLLQYIWEKETVNQEMMVWINKRLDGQIGGIFFQILVNSEWIVIMLSDYSTYLIMSHHLTLIHTLQQLMNSTKLFLQSFNFSFASPEQNRCAIYLRFQKKILNGP